MCVWHMLLTGVKLFRSIPTKFRQVLRKKSSKISWCLGHPTSLEHPADLADLVGLVATWALLHLAGPAAHPCGLSR